MPDRDTEAIRAAGEKYAADADAETIRDAFLPGSVSAIHGRAALGRLVARLEATERALRTIAEAELPHAAPPAVAYRNVARAALAAAAPGETTEPKP